jgi:hypothetical protein
MSCLFRSLAAEAGTNASDILGLIIREIDRRREREHAGVPLREWIYWETGKNVDEYIWQLQHRGWGGFLDVYMASLALKRAILILVTPGQEGQDRSPVLVVPPKIEGTCLTLIYSPGHWTPGSHYWDTLSQIPE